MTVGLQKLLFQHIQENHAIGRSLRKEEGGGRRGQKGSSLLALKKHLEKKTILFWSWLGLCFMRILRSSADEPSPLKLIVFSFRRGGGLERGGLDFLCLLWAWRRICVTVQLAGWDKVAQILNKGSSNSHYKGPPPLGSGRNKDFCCILKY